MEEKKYEVSVALLATVFLEVAAASEAEVQSAVEAAFEEDPVGLLRRALTQGTITVSVDGVKIHPPKEAE